MYCPGANATGAGWRGIWTAWIGEEGAGMLCEWKKVEEWNKRKGGYGCLGVDANVDR